MSSPGKERKTPPTLAHPQAVAPSEMPLRALFLFFVAMVVIALTMIRKSFTTMTSWDLDNGSVISVQQHRHLLWEDGHPEGKSLSPDKGMQTPPVTEANTAIFMIAMGNTTTMNTLLAERCVRSIRVSGQFQGYVILVVDTNEALEKYQQSIVSWDPKTVVLLGRPDDLLPRDEVGDTIRYQQPRMIFKRFKTLLFEYVELHERLSSTVRYVLYMDVDNVVLRDMTNLWDDLLTHSLLPGHYESSTTSDSTLSATKRSNDDSGSRSMSYVGIWPDEGMPGLFHSGVMFADRVHSKHCLEEWRNLIDHSPARSSDQSMLLNIVQNGDCRVLPMPPKEPCNHFRLFHTKFMKQGTLPTITHLTGLRVEYYEEEQLIPVLRIALQLNDTNENEIVHGKVPWKDALRSATTIHGSSRILSKKSNR